MVEQECMAISGHRWYATGDVWLEMVSSKGTVDTDARPARQVNTEKCAFCGLVRSRVVALEVAEDG